MTRLYGRGPRNKREVDVVRHGHWKTSTFIGALRCDGLTAPGPFDGPINGDTFITYVEQVLVPPCEWGMWSSWITFGWPKVKGEREAIEAAGASLMFISPYSPDLNPIEQAFAKLKALLRAKKLRTVEGALECHRQIRGLLHTRGVCKLPPPRRLFPVCLKMPLERNIACPMVSWAFPTPARARWRESMVDGLRIFRSLIYRFYN
jgi:transposase